MDAVTVHDTSVWQPEDPACWNGGGSRLAWRTLTITTANLTLAFITWFLVSALVVKLPGIGFKLSQSQLYWLAAMPGLAGGLLRIGHTFLVPVFGTRRVVGVSSLLLLAPLLGWAMALQDPTTPYWVLLALAFLAGLGGGNFSSFMPSTSLFFPKRLQGTALAIQAGIGNFGVSVVQFATPWVIGVALLGSLAGGPQTLGGHPVWLQNAPLIWTPFVLVFGVVALVALRSVPVQANFRQQLDIFRAPDGLYMTFLYVMTFGTFSGFSATFPLLIKSAYGAFPNAPDPLGYAFLGPLVGSLARVLAGPIADKFGGARVTHWAGLGLLACTVGVTFFTHPASIAGFPYFLALMLGIFFFSGVGNASTFKQMPMLFPPRQAAGVIGWTAAIAAFGPLAAGLLIGVSYAWFGSPNAFFWWAVVFYTVCIAINWIRYARKGAARPC